MSEISSSQESDLLNKTISNLSDFSADDTLENLFEDTVYLDSNSTINISALNISASTDSRLFVAQNKEIMSGEGEGEISQNDETSMDVDSGNASSFSVIKLEMESPAELVKDDFEVIFDYVSKKRMRAELDGENGASKIKICSFYFHERHKKIYCNAEDDITKEWLLALEFTSAGYPDIKFIPRAEQVVVKKEKEVFCTIKIKKRMTEYTKTEFINQLQAGNPGLKFKTLKIKGKTLMEDKDNWLVEFVCDENAFEWLKRVNGKVRYDSGYTYVDWKGKVKARKRAFEEIEAI